MFFHISLCLLFVNIWAENDTELDLADRLVKSFTQNYFNKVIYVDWVCWDPPLDCIQQEVYWMKTISLWMQQMEMFKTKVKL